jgi:Glyoxalase-like domain
LSSYELGFGTNRPTVQSSGLAKNRGCLGACPDIISGMPSPIRVRAVVLDCPDPLALSGFYAELLGWPPDPEPSADNDWAELSSPECSVKIEFQQVSGYTPPTWPEGERPQMLHLDFRVADLDIEHDRALRLGARFLADESPEFRVYADPAGHPFCLCAVDLPN